MVKRETRLITFCGKYVLNTPLRLSSRYVSLRLVGRIGLQVASVDVCVWVCMCMCMCVGVHVHVCGCACACVCPGWGVDICLCVEK